MSTRAAFCAALLLGAACTTKSKEPPEEKADPIADRTQEVRPLVARPLSPPEPTVPAVDPSRVAVEEDFVDETAQRITKRSNLELELQRLAKDIGSAPR